jgi:hypothetical protein
MNAIETFISARRVGAPIVVWKTPDPAASIAAIRQTLGSLADKTPLVEWNVAEGTRTLNDLAKEVGSGVGRYDTMEGLPGALNAGNMLPGRKKENGEVRINGGIFFVHNAHRFIAEAAVMQAVWNLRDKFKSNLRTLVLFCPQMATPIELVNDVVVIDEPLPTEEQIRAIVEGEVKNAAAKTSKEDVSKATSALTGLSAFAAEQAVAMSMTRKGGKAEGPIVLDVGNVWERKRKAIEETRGLSVWRGGDGFQDIAGYENAKRFFTMLIGGKEPPAAYVWIDELEKALGGASGDNTGVTQDQLGVMLSEMQDTEALGALFLGHPGTAKSAMAKSIGNTAEVPTIKLDLGGMKQSEVGASEANIRHAMKVVQSISQGRVCYIATCNKIASLPPELRRRFNLGTFFFDLPSDEERAAIWRLYLDRYGRKEAAPRSDGWTGAEIAQCVFKADRLGCTIEEAARYVAPICADHNTVRSLQAVAHNSFISASQPGIYQMPTIAEEQTSGRRSYE